MRIGACVVAACACVLVAGPAHAERISIAVGGIEKQIHLPELLAERLGFLKDEGLDVDMVSVGDGGVSAENQLISGSVQAVSGSYDHTIDLQSKGKYITTIVQLVRVPAEVEVAGTSSKIASAKDFAGKTLGVTGLGGMTDFLTQAVALQAGVKKSAYSLLPVGAGNTFIAALKQNAMQAGMTTEPTVTRVVSSGGGKILVDLRTPAAVTKALGGPYPGDSLYVSYDWLTTHHAEAQKLANAFVRTLKWIQTHSAEEIAAKLPAGVMAPDPALYKTILDHDKGIFSPDGMMPQGAPANVLKILTATLPTMAGKQIDLSKTYDMEFVKAAQK